VIEDADPRGAAAPGLLLAGRAGTGKTTVAKVLAAQAHAPSYPMLAARTASFSPADLKSLAQEAALAAMTRTGSRDAAPASVTQGDFHEALARLRKDTSVERDSFRTGTA
jgi:SpoVK/Ycf46/Vps4 family AAA+-type ATPase